MTRALISMLIFAAAAIVVALCSVTPAASTRKKGFGGGWSTIKNINDPHIQEVGRWAVSEHIKQASDGLVFSKVVSGKQQVVAGMNYKLVIQVTRGGTRKIWKYKAEVWEKLDMTWELESFNLVK